MHVNLKTPPTEFATLALIAREAGLPDMTARRHAQRLNIAPDAVVIQGSRKTSLFRRSRAVAIVRHLKGATS